MKSILFINKVAELGGAEISLLTLIEDIQKYGYRPFVVLGSDGPLRKRLEELNSKVYIYPLDFPHFKKPIPFVKSVFFLTRLVKSEKIQLIHSNTLWDNQYGVIAAKLSHIPHILHVRGFSKQRNSWKALYNMGCLAICNSKHTKEIFLKYSKFKKKTEVVYNAVDIEKLKPDKKKRSMIRNHYGFTDVDLVMGMAGRLTEEKGQLALLKILIPILKKQPQYKILIAGDAKIHTDYKYPEQISSLIKKNGLNKNVILTGFLKDMTSFYNALDLFLLPSFREPFGRVLIEAMATEIPVIASRVDGVVEVVDHSILGYLVEPSDADDWLYCIDKLDRNESLRIQFGKAGRKKVSKRFTPDQITYKIISIYKELIKC